MPDDFIEVDVETVRETAAAKTDWWDEGEGLKARVEGLEVVLADYEMLKSHRDDLQAKLTALMHGLEVEHIDEMMGKSSEHFETLGKAIAWQAKRVIALVDGVESVADRLDQLADQWGDEGVFRRCRDRLRALVAEEEGII